MIVHNLRQMIAGEEDYGHAGCECEGKYAEGTLVAAVMPCVGCARDEQCDEGYAVARYGASELQG